MDNITKLTELSLLPFISVVTQDQVVRDVEVNDPPSRFWQAGRSARPYLEG